MGFGSSCWKINEQIKKNACTQVTKVQCIFFFFFFFFFDFSNVTILPYFFFFFFFFFLIFQI